MMRVGDVSQPLLLVGDGTGLARARREAGRWVFDAFTTGLHEPANFELAQRAGFIRLARLEMPLGQVPPRGVLEQ